MKFLQNILSWSNLSSLENNRFVKRALVFLFIIPMVAKFLSKVDNPIELKFADYVFTLTISLPFSWIAFYFSALFFAISISLFKIFAPKIISEYSSLGSKVNEGKVWTNLVIYLQDLGITDEYLEKFNLNRSDFEGKMGFVNAGDKLRATNKYKEDKIQKILRKADILTSFYSQLTNKDESVDWDEKEARFIRSQFWTIFHFANKTKFFVRILCGLFYLIGFVLIIYVLGQNINYVWEYYQSTKI